MRSLPRYAGLKSTSYPVMHFAECTAISSLEDEVSERETCMEDDGCLAADVGGCIAISSADEQPERRGWPSALSCNNRQQGRWAHESGCLQSLDWGQDLKA